MTVSNPILARELKERMRALRAPIVLTVYLLLLGLIVFTVERSIAREGILSTFTQSAHGRTIFHWLLLFLLLFLCLMVPSFAAGSISSERERETLHLVQVTTLSPHRIVLGKLGASMAWVTMLVLATLPLVSVSFILGGVSLGDVARGYGFVLFTALTIAMITIGISSRMRRTLGATVLAFLVVATMTVGSLIGYGLVKLATNDRFSSQPQAEPLWTLTINPFIGTASAIQGKDTGGSADTPFEGLFTFLDSARNRSFAQQIVTGPGGTVVTTTGTSVQPGGSGGVPIWVITSLEYVMLMVIGYAVAIGGVRAPRHVFRSGRRRRRGEVEA